MADLKPECSFCQRTARWVVEGERHAFRARACARHAHQALDLALLAGNDRTVTSCALAPEETP